MKKVLTFFCALMVTFLTVGVAKAQTTFQVSEAPSDGAWDKNTKWYIVTLDNFIISSEALEFGNKNLGGAVAFSMSSKNLKDAIKDASLWCVVGDDTNGYKFYNKAKGTGHFLALTNGATDGAARATMVENTTTSSSENGKNGCAFDIKLKGTNYPNIYCIKLHGTNNLYLNNRDNHLSYWDAPQAFNNSARGSQVRFYEYKTNGYCRVGLSSLLLPGVATDNNVSAAETNLSNDITRANVEALESAISNVLATKYYRVNNQQTNGIKQLATDGSNTPKMVSSNNKNQLVNAIWQFILCDNGVKMTNVNNPKGFVAALNDAEYKGTDDQYKGSVTRPLTTEELGIKLEFSKFNDGTFALRDGDYHLLNGEDGSHNDNYALCHWTTDDSWNNGNGRDGNRWNIVEATSIEVALNTLNGKSYASTYLPFGVSTIENATAYVAAAPANGYVTFNTAEGGVAKQNGFLLVSDDAATTATLTIGKGTATSQMRGTLTNLTLDDSNKANYRVFGCLSTDNNILGFFKPSAKLNQVNANRGYFINEAQEALRLNFSGVVSGIETIEANAQNNAPIFDLSGRRVMKTVKGGLYIQNGRKFIVK